MSYRNGNYIAFHAQGTNIPTASDIKYYNLIKGWAAKKDDDFTFTNSHEKTSALRTTSSKETLKARLSERLRNHSKHLLLIVSEETKKDTDWVPFEITYAIDTCKLPVIVVYPGFESIRNASLLSDKWPSALKSRIDNGTASCIHIPFKKEPIADAISQFDLNNKPKSSLTVYSVEAYQSFGIPIN